jgi:hypothetical protein
MRSRLWGRKGGDDRAIEVGTVPNDDNGGVSAMRMRSAIVALCCFVAAGAGFSLPPQRQSLDGIWLSDGCGYVIEFNGDT